MVTRCWKFPSWEVGWALLVVLGLNAVAVPVRAQSLPTRGDLTLERHLARTVSVLDSRTLQGATSVAAWEGQRPRLQRELLDMLGLWPVREKTPLRPTVTGSLDRGTVIIDKLHFESIPGLYVTANLYRPKETTKSADAAKRPAVVLFMGHYNRGRNGHKVFLQDQGLWYAHHGYVCLILDTLERGELPGRSHHGLYRGDRWWWLSAGFTMAGLECWNGIRAIDYLVSRADVDAKRITATGLSGGGTQTLLVSAVDDRVRCVVPASGLTDLEGQIVDGLVAIHCDCQIPNNIYRWELSTIAALIAPRPMLFVNSHDDIGFPMAANRRIMQRVRPLYALYDRRDTLDDFVSQGPAGGHEYRTDSRTAIYRWIHRHNGFDPETVKDESYELVPEEQLRVFPEDKDFPADSINHKADEMFAHLPEIRLPVAGQFETWKQAKLGELRAKAFARFPERVPVSDRVPSPGVFKFRDLPLTDRPQTRTTEIGIETTLRLLDLDTQGLPREKPVALVVLGADDDIGRVPAWAREQVAAHSVVLLAPRGSGPNRLSPATTPFFHHRALAMAGQTLDDGRVWDIAATARWLERPAGVRVVAQGETAVLGVYAGLLEPAIQHVVAIEPPVSHRLGPQLMHVLRSVDIPEAFGLFAPRRLTLIGATDPAFKRTALLYRLAGVPERLH